MYDISKCDRVQSMTDIIKEALDEISEQGQRPTDGRWLEDLTVRCARLISEWDVDEAWLWSKWPDIQKHYPPRTPDIGIDVVAKRKSDGKLIAIQCKSRQLNEKGAGPKIYKNELDKFIAASVEELWVERWLVVNGNVDISINAIKARGLKAKPVKQIIIESDLLKQKQINEESKVDISCPHCTEEGGIQTRDCMQREAIEQSTRILQQHQEKNDGKARGRIILPCGTGKSRIAFRIIEKLTNPGQLAVVLCPSIALVAQLRSEFLAIANKKLKVLAVCSDDTAAKGSDLSLDPTADIGHATADEVKGTVTTDSNEIEKWINDISGDDERIGVIFGTYQSSHRIAEALTQGKEVQVMIADEAHRTAGLKRKNKNKDEKKIKDFTICHDDNRFPAKYRIYQTATPRVYSRDERNLDGRNNDKIIIRDMADEETFGPELYRRTYKEAVENGWLTDYRIIAMGVNDNDAYNTANNLAALVDSKLSSAQYLKGLVLALVMGGGLRKEGVQIRSSINFMNRIKNSKEMTSALNTKEVKKWVKKRVRNEGRQSYSHYRLEHLDAESRVSDREYAKARLMGATNEKPHGVINVGIFGEGVDTPALSAISFLEARKSPVEVIQAVGRVMRLSKDKELGYIICPILIPLNVNAEDWLVNSCPKDGWRELGQTLQALRAHDVRIEEKLGEKIDFILPPPPTKEVATMIVIGGADRRADYYGHIGKIGSAVRDIKKVLSGQSNSKEVFEPIEEVLPNGRIKDSDGSLVTIQRIVSGKKYQDGEIVLREAGIERDKSKDSSGSSLGPVNIDKSKKTGMKMLNGEAGRKISPPPHRMGGMAIRLQSNSLIKLVSVLISLKNQGLHAIEQSETLISLKTVFMKRNDISKVMS